RASYANAKGQGHKHGSLYNIRDESSINAAASGDGASTAPTASCRLASPTVNLSARRGATAKGV
ncbi:hypothetical protein K525DRAFT_258195, partial [Schizophyllum commune Loenen D]